MQDATTVFFMLVLIRSARFLPPCMLSPCAKKGQTSSAAGIPCFLSQTPSNPNQVRSNAACAPVSKSFHTKHNKEKKKLASFPDRQVLPFVVRPCYAEIKRRCRLCNGRQGASTTGPSPDLAVRFILAAAFRLGLR